MNILKGLFKGMKSKISKLVNNSILFVLGEIGSKAVIFFLVPFYTYVLSAEEYSVCDLITTTVILLSPFFVLVINETVMRFSLDDRENIKQIFTIGLSVVCIGSALLSFIAILLRQYFISLQPYLIYLVCYFFMSNVYSLECSFIKGLDKVKIYSIVSVLNTTILLLFNIVFLSIYKMGITGYFLASILSLLISIFYMSYKINILDYLIYPLLIDSGTLKSMLRYSLPMIPNSAMWWINNSSDRYIITYFISLAANGVYSIGYKIPSILSVLVSVFMQAWQISVVDDFGTKEGNIFFNEVYNIFLKVNITIATILIFFSKYIGKLIFNGEFYEAWKISAILVLGYSFHSLAGFLGTVFTTVKKTSYLMKSTVISAFLNILLNLIFVGIVFKDDSYYAIIATAISTVISYLACYLWRRKMVINFIPIKVSSIDFICQYLLLVLMTILLIVDNTISLIVAIFIFMFLLRKQVDILTKVSNKFSYFIRGF